MYQSQRVHSESVYKKRWKFPIFSENLKFRFLEKATKIWHDLPQGLHQIFVALSAYANFTIKLLVS